ncbi:hypothetical protein PtB15_6B319 [Puccinia triticina]|nr:hypothetical protein PtB15_6B319 [Puccinia triticina]
MFSMMIFLALSVAGLLPSCVSGQAQNNLTCYVNRSAKPIDFRHCQGALNKISYDQHNRLDSVSSRLFVWHKTCTINVHKTTSLTPSRAHIEGSVRELFHHCNSTGGLRSEPQMNTRVSRANALNAYPVNQPICRKRKCNFQPNDCLLAFNQIPVDHKGNFVPNLINNAVRVKRGNCSVVARTTDRAPFRTSHPQLNSAFKQLLSRCGNHPGKIFVPGGTAGRNGAIKISIRARRLGTCK